jgi:hypothetical protein
VHLDTGTLHLHGVLPEIGELEVASQQTTVRMRRHPHPPDSVGSRVDEFGDWPAVGVEQLVRSVAAHPPQQNVQMLGRITHVADRNLVRTPGAFDR